MFEKSVGVEDVYAVERGESGTGCTACDETVQRIKHAVAQCGCPVITRAPDSPEAKQYGIRAVPAIVVDGQLVFTGLPTQEQANALLTR